MRTCHSPQRVSNFGSGKTLLVQGPGPTAVQTYIRFDLTTLPVGTRGADVPRAVLRLWVSRSRAAGCWMSIRRAVGERHNPLRRGDSGRVRHGGPEEVSTCETFFALRSATYWGSSIRSFSPAWGTSPGLTWSPRCRGPAAWASSPA